MNKLKNLLLLLICICFMNCTPALAQTSKDSAKERTNSQKKGSPGDDQAADLNGRGEKKMLEDTGGKSGTQGIGKDDRNKTERKEASQTADAPGSRDRYVIWGIVLLVAFVLAGLVIRYVVKDNRIKQKNNNDAT
ncbi:hypothetical protein SAMN05216464_111145 [Mucilaginibacter pineti]|uniref:Uncharacterized protein n=1 Tax=Mucilaginibacter pineti TaxID=1391627 RepID=A0A1G7HB30_9SPHI|nr:hypothetical protein [Mucilaginibacter pineti]SDE97561.1 hypothetical protein SAMN05216464_111145 [Mucilaginibacter pineti]